MLYRAIMFVSLQFKLELENKQDRERVLSLMRLQSSMIRFIYNRLKEGKKETEIYKLVKEVFKIPSWYISSALQRAKSLPDGLLWEDYAQEYRVNN